jgi:hypothetical protein
MEPFVLLIDLPEDRGRVVTWRCRYRSDAKPSPIRFEPNLRNASPVSWETGF